MLIPEFDTGRFFTFTGGFSPKYKAKVFYTWRSLHWWGARGFSMLGEKTGFKQPFTVYLKLPGILCQVGSICGKDNPVSLTLALFFVT